MSTNQKLRGGSESELTKLKAVWRKLSADARVFWSELFVSDTPQAEVRKQLLAKLKVHLRHDSQLNKFRDWVEAQAQRELMAEKIEERKAELLAGGMKLEDAQEVLLTEAAAYSTAARDFKLGMKVSSEITKKSVSKLDEQKFIVDADFYFERLLAKAGELNTSSLSNAEKIAAMRAEAFKSVDELQASGKIKIPKA